MIDLAIDAGLVAAFFGVQHGSEKFCREIYNRINCNEHYLTLARKFFDRGIMSEWSYIIGNLLENEKDFEETLDFAKQMPFDPGLAITTEVSMSKLRIFKNTPLEKIYPSGEYDPQKMYYNAQLMRLRPLLDDAGFARYRTTTYQENPSLLANVIDQRKHFLHEEYLIHEAERLKGQEVYFYGFGESYSKNKLYFAECHPVCILHDLEHCDVSSMDNIPVRHIKDVFSRSDGQILPVVIFSYGAYIIHRKLLRDYPQLTDKVFVQLR